MLHSKLFTFQFYIFSQNGFYLDFFFKKINEILLRNFLIYSAQFFGEKYLIEFFTKLIFNFFFFKFFTFYEESNFIFEFFFYNIIISLLFFISFLQFIIFFF